MLVIVLKNLISLLLLSAWNVVNVITKHAFPKLKLFIILCLSINTQNNNKCCNKTLLSIALKHSFSGKEVVELAVHISLSMFNERQITFLKMLEVNAWLHCWNGCLQLRKKKKHKEFFGLESQSKSSDQRNSFFE